MGSLILSSDAIRMAAESYRRGQLDAIETLIEGVNNPAVVAFNGEAFTERVNSMLGGVKARIPSIAETLALLTSEPARPSPPRAKPEWDNNPNACCLHDGERALAIVRYSEGKWFGYDARHPNDAAGDGMRRLGSFMSLSAAKEAIEHEVCAGV